MSELIREAIDARLTAEGDLDATRFGPGIAARVPSRQEWERRGTAARLTPTCASNTWPAFADCPVRLVCLAYSVVKRAELLAGASDDEPQVRRLLAGMEELPIGRQVADRAGLLRRDVPNLPMPDALVAATALVHSIALHTKNRRDFARVPGLRLRGA